MGILIQLSRWYIECCFILWVVKWICDIKKLYLGYKLRYYFETFNCRVCYKLNKRQIRLSKTLNNISADML